MKLEPITYILPAYWASYLINGDYSGISPEEKKQADKFIEGVKLGMPVSCSEESYFSKYNDAGLLPGDVLEYTFLMDKIE